MTVLLCRYVTSVNQIETIKVPDQFQSFSYSSDSMDQPNGTFSFCVAFCVVAPRGCFTMAFSYLKEIMNIHVFRP